MDNILKIKIATEGEEKGLSTHELRKVLHEMGNVTVPGLGRAFSELALGPVGAAMALATAFEKLREKLAETGKALDELTDKEIEDHRSAVEALAKAWNDNAVAWQKYQDALKDAGEDKDPLATQLKRIQEVSAAQTAAHLKRVEELNKERILWMQANGASETQISAAEESARRQQEKITDTDAHDSADWIQHDIDKRKEDQASLDANVKATQDKATEAQNKLDQANQDKANAKPSADDKVRDERIEESQEYIEQQKIGAAKAREAGNNWLAGTFELGASQGQEQLAPLLAQQKIEKAAQEAADKKIHDALVAQKAAEDAAAHAEEIATENKNQITKETTELGTAKQVQATKETEQTKQTILNLPAARENGHIINFGQLAEETGKTNDQIEGLLRGLLDHHYNLQTVIAQMVQQLQTIKQQQQASGYSTH